MIVNKVGDILILDDIKNIISSNMVYLLKQSDDEYVNWLSNKIIYAFTAYRNLDLLYPQSDAKDMFDALLWENAPELLMRCKLDNSKFSKAIFNDDGLLGTYTMETDSNVGYTGFDSQNQDSTFEKNKSKTSYKGNQTIQYLTFLDMEFTKWAKEFKDTVLKRLARQLY